MILLHSLNTWGQTWQQGSVSGISSPASKKIACHTYQLAAVLGPWPILPWRTAKRSAGLTALQGWHIPRTKALGASITVSVAVTLTSWHSALEAMRKDRCEHHGLSFFPCEMILLAVIPLHLWQSLTTFSGPDLQLVPPGLDETMTLIYAGWWPSPSLLYFESVSYSRAWWFASCLLGEHIY